VEVEELGLGTVGVGSSGGDWRSQHVFSFRRLRWGWEQG
jgi:hypothetical protein